MKTNLLPVIFLTCILGIGVWIVLSKEQEEKERKAEAIRLSAENKKNSSFKIGDVVSMADGIKFRVYNINQFGTHLQNLQTGVVLESVDEATIRKWSPPAEKQ